MAFPTILYIAVYISNIKDVYATGQRVAAGGTPKRFRAELAEMLDARFYQTVSFLHREGV